MSILLTLILAAFGITGYEGQPGNQSNGTNSGQTGYEGQPGNQGNHK